MYLLEYLVIVIALSLNVFLVAEYEGSMLKAVDLKKLACVSGIFFIWQIVSMLLGHLVTVIPFFERASGDLRTMCYGIAAILFLILAVYMLYRGLKKEKIIEHLSEIRYKRIFSEAMVIAIFTFLAGIGCGFLGTTLWSACAIVAGVTILAVIAGIYMGYHQGYRFRKGIFLSGGVLFLIIGIDIIVRFL